MLSLIHIFVIISHENQLLIVIILLNVGYPLEILRIAVSYTHLHLYRRASKLDFPHDRPARNVRDRPGQGKACAGRGKPQR